MVAWMVEMFVVRLGLRTVSITASKSAEERAATLAEFTSPRSGCQVLITTYNRGATGLNLHGNCHIVVLIENAF
jgi:SNF2 family DNA or RNA helicase